MSWRQNFTPSAIQQYHNASDPNFSNWYTIGIGNAQMRTLAQRIFDDKTHTLYQQHAFEQARNSLEVTAETFVSRQQKENLLETYNRILSLYEARLGTLNMQGAKRYSEALLLEVNKASISDRTRRRLEDELWFLDADFYQRKLEFAGEVFAVLEKEDARRAEEVLANLLNTVPKASWYVHRLRYYETDYTDFNKKIPLPQFG